MECIFERCSSEDSIMYKDRFEITIKILQDSGIKLDRKYYQCLEKTHRCMYSMDNNLYFAYVQTGIDLGIKIGPKRIHAYNAYRRPNTISKYNQSHTMATIVPVILIGLSNIKNTDQVIIEEVIIQFVKNIDKSIETTYGKFINEDLSDINLDTLLLQKQLKRYYLGEISSFAEILNILIEEVILSIDSNSVRRRDHNDSMRSDIESVKKFMSNAANIDPKLITYVEHCVTKLATINNAFNIKLDIKQNLYLYRGLKPDKIANYDEWYTAERQDIYRSNKIKLERIVDQRIKDNGNLQRYTNLLIFSDKISQFC